MAMYANPRPLRYGLPLPEAVPQTPSCCGSRKCKLFNMAPFGEEFVNNVFDWTVSSIGEFGKEMLVYACANALHQQSSIRDPA